MHIGFDISQALQTGVDSPASKPEIVIFSMGELMPSSNNLAK